MKEIVRKRLDFFESLNIRQNLSNDNKNLVIWCPYCNNKNKQKLKMCIELEKSIYHCWVCDKKGSNVSYLIKKVSPKDFERSLELFKNKNYKYKLFETEEEQKEKQVVKLPDDFMFLTQCFDSIDPDIKDVFKYAIKRGVSKHKMWYLRLGVSVSNDLRRCLIIPSYDKNGDLNFYTARKIDQDTRSSFKYKNASINKNDIVFNELNIDFKKPLTIVEGPLDLIKTNDNSTCLLGSSLNKNMKLFQEIVKNNTKVYLALDDDAYDKMVKIARNLSEFDIDVNILNTKIENNKDIGDISREQFNKLYNESKKYHENDSLLSKIRNIF